LEFHILKFQIISLLKINAKINENTKLFDIINKDSEEDEVFNTGCEEYLR